MGLRRRTFDRTRGEEGAITILTAALLMAMLAATSLGVDVGRVAYVSRDQQGVTERAALDALAAFEGRPADTSLFLQAVESEVGASLTRNPARGGAQDRHVHSVELGTVDRVTKRFVALDLATTPSASVDAVRVRTRSGLPFIFPFPAGEDGRQIDRVSVAQLKEPVATISTASVTAGVNDGLLNQLLAGVLGVDAALVGYEGLANATVRLGDIAAELGVGTWQELLAEDVRVGEFVRLVGRVLQADGDLGGIEAAVGRLVTFPIDLPALPSGQDRLTIGDILVAGSTDDAALDATVDALSLVTAAIQAVAPDNHVVTLDLGVPRVSNVRLTLIEHPRIAVGPVGTRAETAQVRLEFDLALTGLLGGVTSTITSLLSTLLLGTLQVDALSNPLAVRVNAAHGVAEITSIECPDHREVGTDAWITTAGATVPTTNIIRARLNPPLLPAYTLGHVAVRANVAAGASPVHPLHFSEAAEPFPTAAKVVPATHLGLAGLLQPTTTAGAGLQVTTDIAGLSLGSVVTSLASSLTPVLQGLDDTLSATLGAIGVDLGTAHVRTIDAKCGGRTLIRERGDQVTEIDLDGPG